MCPTESEVTRMKLTNKFLCILLLIFVFTLNAQERRAIFLHGYDSYEEAWTVGTQTPNTPEGTPEFLVSEGIIQSYETPYIASLNLGAIGFAIQNEISDDDGDKWVMVGHSMGGLIARGAVPYLTDGDPFYYIDEDDFSLSDIDLVGVLTLGTPHQGAPVADCIQNDTENKINTYKAKIEEAPLWEMTNGYGPSSTIVGLVTGNVSLLAGSIVVWGGEMYLYHLFSTYLRNTYYALMEYINGSEDNQSAKLIPGSDFLTSLNSQTETPLPPNYLSISGVESSPAVVRMANSLAFAGDRNEEDVVHDYEMIKYTYDQMGSSYEVGEIGLLSYAAFQLIRGDFVGAAISTALALNYGEGKDKWKSGASAIADIDREWAAMHNTDMVSTYIYKEVEYWQDCQTGSPPGGWGGDPSLDDLEALFLLPECGDQDVISQGGFWDTKIVAYFAMLPDKTDGFIPLNKTKWNPSDANVSKGGLSTTGASRNNTNVYFDGTGESDGGYNHWEIREVTRDYGNHDTNQPMRVGAEWIDYIMGVN